MYSMEDSLKKSYKQNIEAAKEELSYHYSEIRRLNFLIKQNTTLINALTVYQTKFCDLDNEREVLNATN